MIDVFGLIILGRMDGMDGMEPVRKRRIYIIYPLNNFSYTFYQIHRWIKKYGLFQYIFT
jgi:hypothetical protein